MALTAGKAKKMLEDGTVHGRALTDKQKRYFGAIAGGATPMKKIKGGWLDKYAMGGTLPGASGMMYARTDTPEPLYTQSEMKAQRGNEVAIDSTRVNIPAVERFDSPKFPFTEGLQQLPEVVVNAPRRQPMISQGRPRGNESLQRIQEDDTSLPTSAMPLTYLANPFRIIGDVYNATVVPVGNYFSPYDNFQPITGNFFTSDEVARQLNNRKLQYQRGQITKGEQLYGNLKQALPETAFALVNVGGGYAYRYLKSTPIGQRIGDIGQRIGDTFKNFFNPSAAPIGRDTFVPQIFNRTAGPPNRLMSNPKADADNFMKSWTNAPGFNARFESQIKPYYPMNTPAGIPPAMPWTIESSIASRTRQLQTLQGELAKYETAGLQNALPKSRYLQQQIDDLTTEINLLYDLYYPGLARQNIKAIQAGEFPTVYSSTGFTPGSGGTYYVPTANQPLNTLKTFDDAATIGNKSVVKLGEVSPRASNRLLESVRTREMLTGIHETLGHASNIGGRALNMEAKELIKGALKRDPKILKGTNKSIEEFLGPGSTFEDYAKYLQDPTEMVARVMELRRLYINPKYWGTSKQYDIPDKLIDQIFRDGLGGRTKIASDFFRVVDKEGLKKLMKGLYAAIPMAYNAEGLLEYKYGGKAQKGEVLGFDNVLDYVVKTRGGDRDTWGAVADTIAFHESGPRQRMDPKARQYPKGPGRGVFQFEGPSFITAQNRYKTVANVMGVDVNPNILNAKSADELSLKDQYTLFYVNMLEGPAELGKYPKGEIDLIDLWLDGHKLIESEGNRESFLESQREAQEKGIEGGYKTFKTGGWLDKYEVIEDDMGQLTNPGKITKINSNNITMKGVDFPVLGISDTGDKKMMLPGKDYKFDGNSVTEYPMKGQGGMNVPLKTVNEFGELERLTYPSSTFKDKEGKPEQLVMLDEVVVEADNPITVAKEQMEKYGITDQLREGYVKGKSEKAFNNITPQGYGDQELNMERLSAFLKGDGRNPDSLLYQEENGKKEYYTIPTRDDAFSLYLGLPQKNDSFSVSDYKPSQAKDPSTIYYKPWWADEDKYRQRIVYEYFDGGYKDVEGSETKKLVNERTALAIPSNWKKDGDPWSYADNALGDFTVDYGEDEKGHYIAIYDKWDLNPFEQGEGSSVNQFGSALLNAYNKLRGKNPKATADTEVSEIFGAGKPFEIYERIYFDPKTQKIIDMKQGGSLVTLDQLTNFTNYNTPQPGGWLDKYN